MRMNITKMSLPALTSLIVALLLLAACTRTMDNSEDKPLETIHTIVVIPTETTPDKKNGKETNSGQLAEGVMTMDRALQNYFLDKPDVKILPAYSKEMNGIKGGNRLSLIRQIGKHMQGDAVLTCSVNRFIKRQGNKYSVDSPASVAFECQLISVESGRALCYFSFDETQQPLSENLLDLPGAARRGFKWVTAEELMKDGLNNKLTTCPYLVQ